MFKLNGAKKAPAQRAEHIPGKMEMMEYDEVSPCEWPANGRPFLVRRSLSEAEEAALASAGVKAPPTLEDVIRSAVDSAVEKISAIWRSKESTQGDQPVDQTNEQANEAVKFEEVARSIASEIADQKLAEYTETQRSQGERIAALEEQIAALQATQQQQTETVQEVQRSLDSIRPGNSSEDREGTPAASAEQVQRHSDTQSWADILKLNV
jgi:flagellar motility protein MotE (MotC chaperone)